MKLPRFLAAVVGCSLACQAFALPQNDAARPKRLRIEPEVAAKLLTHSVEPSAGPGPLSTVSTVSTDTPVEKKQPPSNGSFVAEVCSNSSGGEVVLDIVIDRQGKVIGAAPVLRDELPPNPPLTDDGLLQEPAIRAVKQWEYKPYLLDSQPIEVETRVVVKFKPGPICRIIGGEPQPKPAGQQVLRVSAKVLERSLLKHVDPVYPAQAREAHIQGVVQLAIEVSKNGTVSLVKTISGHPLLAQSAEDAVKQWEYKPFLVNGDPVEVKSWVTVTFKM